MVSSGDKWTIVELFTSAVLHCLYTLIHFVISVKALIGFNIKSIRSAIYVSKFSNSPHSEVEEIKTFTKSLSKIPKHIAFALTLEEPRSHSKFLDVKQLAKLIYWAWVSNIRFVSLYDSAGLIKLMQEDLQEALEKEIAVAVDSSLKDKISTDFPELVKVQFYSVADKNNFSFKSMANDQNRYQLDSLNTLHVNIFSRQDGKSRILETIRKISKTVCRDVPVIMNESSKQKGCLLKFNKSSTLDEDEITEERLNTLLENDLQYDKMCEKGISMEPDLLLVLGNVHSTQEFLPWHIRLTEIHWLPALPSLDSSDFMGSLKTFAGCEQRLGK